jgi:hypothetical protein
VSSKVLPNALRHEISLLLKDPRYGSSNRVRDRARSALKRRGLIRFNRAAWEWEVLPEAIRQLGASE